MCTYICIYIYVYLQMFMYSYVNAREIEVTLFVAEIDCVFRGDNWRLQPIELGQQRTHDAEFVRI